MNVRVQVAENFKKEAKPLLKKYPSLRSELASLEIDLCNNPALGTPLGGNVYKIRLAVKSKGRGKSGGARVITYVEIGVLAENSTSEGTVVNLISIYDKSELSTLSDIEIQRIIRSLEGG
jgi:mRNA-degrading endonuclease RelE of RelBE toxin-antitoxin system